jgi:thiamine biosynthesis lipoprotein
VNGFRSMGCDIALPYGAPVEEVRALFAARDACFSRFQPSSEINRVNAHPLGLTLVSEEFASMLSLSLDAACATDGLVSPCVGGALIGAGYDRDFACLPVNGVAAQPAPIHHWTTISLHGPGLLRTEPVILDLNGVVKGRTVDDALELAGRGWISAGGDVATLESLVVGLPAGGAVTLHGGGLATSSVAKRRWHAGGERQHHLIDPRTGRPADGPWRDVSVVAATCLAADVAAKAALLLGDRGPAWLEERGLAGRFVGHDDRVLLTSAWERRAPERKVA